MRWAVPAVALAVVAVAGTGLTVAATGSLGSPEGQAAAAAAAPVAEPAAGSGPEVLPLDPVQQPSASPAAARDREESPPAPPPSVRPLSGLAVPDLLVRTPRPLPADRLLALEQVRGVTARAVLDTGTVEIAGKDVRVAGVDPSEFRGFTPKETAESDPLWQSVARGEVALTYSLAKTKDLALGGRVTVTGARPVQERVGAHAAFGLPDVDAVVDREGARSYGAVSGGAVLLAAPGRSIETLRAEVRRAAGPTAEVVVLRPRTVRAGATKPRSYRELYVQSATLCPGMRWQLLAAVGQIESGHGRNNGPSSAGALGPMQFLPSTWAAYGVDGDSDGDADINDPFDAVPSAALYLCRFGAGRGGQSLYDAVYAYNHLDSYVQDVLALADKYR